jgi:hypothetical protein
MGSYADRRVQECVISPRADREHAQDATRPRAVAMSLRFQAQRLDLALPYQAQHIIERSQTEQLSLTVFRHRRFE